MSDDAQRSLENKSKQELKVKDKKLTNCLQSNPSYPWGRLHSSRECSAVVNERTVFPTFLEEGKTLTVSGGLVFDPYKHGSGLSHPLGFTLVLSHLVRLLKPILPRANNCCVYALWTIFWKLMWIRTDLFNSGTKFKRSKNSKRKQHTYLC